MNETESLYQSVILERSRQPRFRRRLTGVPFAGKCANPLCGDEVAVELHFDHAQRISEVGFWGEGCAILLAASDLMAEAVTGLAADQACALGEAFDAMLGGGADVADRALACFGPLRAYPARRRCATLAWEALGQAVTPVGEGA